MVRTVCIIYFAFTLCYMDANKMSILSVFEIYDAVIARVLSMFLRNEVCLDQELVEEKENVRDVSSQIEDAFLFSFPFSTHKSLIQMQLKRKKKGKKGRVHSII